MKIFKAYVFSEVNATAADLFKKEGKSEEQIEKALGDISKPSPSISGLCVWK